MSKIESSSKKSRGTGTISLALAFSVAALMVSGAAFAAKPVPALNATVCQGMSGVWTSPVCTIPATANGVASSDFKISKSNTLDVRGSLTINAGVLVSNAGAITVQNVGGVVAEYGSGLPAGVLIFGTLDNAGTITIGNLTDSTLGIDVAFTVTVADPMDPRIVPGVLTNSGTITIQNGGQNQGIGNLGTLTNATTGAIMIVNGATASTGIRNDRYGSGQYVVGTMTNAGSISVANTGDGGSRGISNAGSFTNYATGTFTINASAVTDVLAFGLRNNGTFTNFGTFVNNRGTYNRDFPLSATWGSYNLSPGAMLNYGKTSVGTPTEATGTFYNELMMINLGEITSHGVLFDAGGIMVNYGTIYNYGLINGGANVGLCIDEPGSGGGC